MFSSALRPCLALVLLLCLGRTLLPETWVLAWHAHPHTTYEAAHSARYARPQLLLSPRHQHCHTEQFYNAPYAPASIVQLPQLHRRPRYLALRAGAERACSRGESRGRCLRGPPVRAAS